MKSNVCSVSLNECEVLQDLGRYCDTLHAFAEATDTVVVCPIANENITLHECCELRRTTDKVMSLLNHK